MPHPSPRRKDIPQTRTELIAEILMGGSLDFATIPRYCATQLRTQVGNRLPTLPIRFAPSLPLPTGGGEVCECHTWRTALANQFRARILFTLAAALFVFLTPLRTTGSDEWLPLDPADLKMTSEPAAPGAPAIYLYRQVDRKDSGRANTEYNYVRIKILTEEGRQFANVEIPYRSDKVGISNIRARTIRPDGSIVNFDGKAFDKTIEKTKGIKIHVRTFTVPDVQVGSIVEYHFNYDYEDGFVFNSYWLLSEELFTRTAKFTLKPYDKFAVRWTWPIGLPPGTDQPRQEQDGYIRMVSHNIPAFQSEEYMPPADEMKFRVIFIYSDEAIEMDEAKYWRKYGKKQNERVESFVSKRKELEAAAAQIVSPSDAPEVKLQKIYARCQGLRNLSFETLKSAAEEKRDKERFPENAAEVLKFGYGFGGDINRLFVGLARAAGLDAYAVRVPDRSERFFNAKVMNSSELDSIVALVKVDGKEEYFDPGTPFVPYGLLSWPYTNVKGLKLDKEGGSWVLTPLPQSAVSEIQRKADLKLDEEGTLEGKITLTFTGLEAASRRLRGRKEDEEAHKKYLEDLIKDYIPAAMEADLKNHPEWKSSTQPLVAEFEVKIPGWAASAGHNVIFPVGLFGATEKHMFEHASRVNPVYFSYPFIKKDDITVTFPSAWKVSGTPNNVDEDAKAAEYILKLEGKSGTLHLARTIRSDLVMVQRDMYPSLRGFFQVVKTSDDQQIVLQPQPVAASK